MSNYQSRDTKLDGPSDSISCVRFNPDGNLVVGGSWDTGVMKKSDELKLFFMLDKNDNFRCVKRGRDVIEWSYLLNIRFC